MRLWFAVSAAVSRIGRISRAHADHSVDAQDSLPLQVDMASSFRRSHPADGDANELPVSAHSTIAGIVGWLSALFVGRRSRHELSTSLRQTLMLVSHTNTWPAT